MHTREFCVLIRPTMPSCPWIEEFIADVGRHGGNARRIAWECGILQETGFTNTPRVSDEFKAVTGTVQNVCLPLLAPRFHTNRDEDLLEYGFILASNPLSFVVHDGSLETDRLIKRLRTFVDPARIKTRAEALTYLVEQTNARQAA